MSAPTESAHEQHQLEESKRPPLLSLFQWVLLIPACTATVFAGLWPSGDLVYRGHFETPDGWWLLVLVGLVAWGTFIVRCGQERLIRQNQTLIDYMDWAHRYHADLGERLDAYGNEREIRGHHLAATIHGNGNGRSLHVVD